MRRIRLLSLPDSRLSRDDPMWEANRVDYRATIEQAIRIPLDRQSGATIDEMRKGIRILDALDASIGDVVQLEDADWEHLKQKVERMPWAVVDRRFIQFYDDIMGATESPRDPERIDGVASA